ncbi:MAG: ABC transporter substrate-binding protein [Desulfobacteraceae bacterium]|nr:ABC transporter substrate-binding protein [Desulfobacteraceae bacterium]
MKKSVLLLCVCLLLTAGAASAKGKDTFVKATYGTVRTLDPACSYDTTSGMRLYNLYERLVAFDGGSTQDFIPELAAEVPTVENGGISRDGKTYRFKIRKGVRFHDGSILTPEDVEYSFERGMICDQAGGPQWMMLEALTGNGATRDGDDKIIPGVFEKIVKAVDVEGGEVVFRLPAPYPPLMAILQYASSSIINKKWAIANGCWDGKIENAAKYNSPDFNTEPLHKIENGTGPYVMKEWVPSNQFVFERFDGYWEKKPAIKTAIVKYVPEWTTRKLMLQNGDADQVEVDATYLPEIETMKDVTINKFPILDYSAAIFCQDINPAGNPDIGSGKLDGNGIPPKFFSDIHVRKAFSHCIDWTAMKEDVGNNLINLPGSPNCIGLPYYKEVPLYEFSLKKAAAEMKKAWGGKVWEKGFKMTITHNTGNALREAAAQMMAENIMELNPKFQIEVRNVDWKDYTVKYRQFAYPMFIIGWGADFPDPHNFLYTFMHSNGVYGKYAGFKDEEVDSLCNAGIKNVDPAKRKEIYGKLQDKWYELAVGNTVYQKIGLKPYRSNVKGFVPNPMFDMTHEYLKDLYFE